MGDNYVEVSQYEALIFIAGQYTLILIYMVYIVL